MKEEKIVNDREVASESTTSSSVKSSPNSSPTKKGKNILNCKVVALDGTELGLEVEKNADGEALFSKIVEKLHLIEKDYFGLKFVHYKTQHEEWLDLHKGIKRQLSNGAPNFNFRVKFYEPEPARLLDEYTRYLLYLQLRDDIVSGRLSCPTNSYVVLGSYTAQAEVGDFDPLEHQGPYLDDYQFSPNEDAQILQRVKDLHRQHRGQTPAQAELNFLEHAKKIPNYGVDLHDVKDEKGNLVEIGVAPAGFVVYPPKDKEDKEKVVLDWHSVDVISYKKKTFHVRLKPPEKKKEKVKRNYDFKLNSTRASKRLYKAAVEYHTFFRLTRPDPPRKKGTLKIGSSFRYSDRTLYQLRSRPNLNESGSPFSRSPSKRRTVHGVPGSRSGDDDSTDANDRKARGNDVIQEPPIQYEEVEIDESDPNASQYNKEEWEVIEKIMPDGSRKKIRRRIITTTTVTTTTTTYVLHGQVPEEEGPVMEIKSIEDSSSPVTDSQTESPTKEKVEEITIGPAVDEKPALAMNFATPEHSPRPPDYTRTETLPVEEDIKPIIEETEEQETTIDGTTSSSTKKTTVTTITTVTTVKTGSLQEEKDEDEAAVTEVEITHKDEAATEEPNDDLELAEAVLEEAEFGFVSVEQEEDVKTAKLVLEKYPEDERAEVAEKSHISEEDLVTRRHKSFTLDRNFKRRPPPEKAHRHSYGNELDDYYDDRETMTMPRKGKKKIQLVTREEIIRAYSSGGLTDDNVRQNRERVAPEIQYSLKEDLHLNHEQGESGFVKGQIGRHESVSKVQNGDEEKKTKSLSTEEKTVMISVVTKPTSFGDETERVETFQTTEPPEVKTAVNVVHPKEEDPEEAVFEVIHTDELHATPVFESEPPAPVDTTTVVLQEGVSRDTPQEIKEPGLVETQTISMVVTEPKSGTPQLMASTGAEPGMVETRSVTMGETVTVSKEPTQIITKTTTTTLPTEYTTHIVTVEGDESALTPEELEKLMGEMGVSDEAITVNTTVAKREVVKTVKTTHVQKKIVTESKAVVVSGEDEDDLQKFINESLNCPELDQLTLTEADKKEKEEEEEEEKEEK